MGLRAGDWDNFPLGPHWGPPAQLGQTLGWAALRRPMPGPFFQGSCPRPGEGAQRQPQAGARPGFGPAGAHFSGPGIHLP